MSLIKNNIIFIHELFSNYIKNGDIVIDATLGNGHDTIFLANLVGLDGMVYSFDIEKKAIEISKKKLIELKLLPRVKLLHVSHAYLKDFVYEKVSGIIFNLGYLPNSNKKITTLSHITLQAIEQGLSLLKNNAILAIMIYTGHQQGKIESQEIEKFVKNLPQQKFNVLQYKFINRINNPPYAVIIEKLLK